MSNDLPISIRMRKQEDAAFIYASWLSHQKKETPCRFAPSSIYDIEQTKKIDHILSISQCLMAYIDPIPNEPEKLLSYIIYQFQNNSFILHFAFTKSAFRSIGIFNKLITTANTFNLPIILTAEPAFNPKQHSITYDPFYFQRGNY